MVLLSVLHCELSIFISLSTLHCSLQGACVLVADLKSSDGAATAKEMGDNATFVATDVSPLKLNGSCSRIMFLTKGDPSTHAHTRSRTHTHTTHTQVTSESDVKNALQVARERYGAVTVAVNCAGIAIAKRTLTKKGPHPLEEFHQIIKVS